MASIIGGGWLRDDAARYFNALQEHAMRDWGAHMPVTSAGRTVEEQWRLYNGWVARLPGFSPAYPGNSSYALHVVNGGGAVDIGGRFAISGTAQHEWLKRVAPIYGYAVNAVPGEPWHIQFTLTPTVALGGGSVPIEEEDEMQLLYVYIGGGAPVGVIGTINRKFAPGEFVNFRNVWGTEETPKNGAKIGQVVTEAGPAEALLRAHTGDPAPTAAQIAAEVKKVLPTGSGGTVTLSDADITRLATAIAGQVTVPTKGTITLS